MNTTIKLKLAKKKVSQKKLAFKFYKDVIVLIGTNDKDKGVKVLQRDRESVSRLKSWTPGL